MKVLILGQGYVGSTLTTGVERIKNDEIDDTGVPFRDELDREIEDIEFLGAYEVDKDKIGKDLYEVSQDYSSNAPESLKDKEVKRGVDLGSLRDMEIEVDGLDSEYSLKECVDFLYEEWLELDPDVIVNVCTTEEVEKFGDLKELERVIEGDDKDRITANQLYAYIAGKYAKKRGGAAFVNAIPTPIANDPAYLEIAEESNLVIFGDDGASGATPLTSDILEHEAERARKVESVAQFNIGGNNDFLALTQEGKNKSKEKTKSSIVENILGYEPPNYIKPTGYLEPLGDNKFVSMHMVYESFNGAKDEIILNARMNDSPALAGLLVDTIRLGMKALEGEDYGTVPEVNGFFMKDPGPESKKAASRILAYKDLLEWANI